MRARAILTHFSTINASGPASPTRCELVRLIVAEGPKSNQIVIPDWNKGPTPVLQDQQEAKGFCMGTTSTRPVKGLLGKWGFYVQNRENSNEPNSFTN